VCHYDPVTLDLSWMCIELQSHASCALHCRNIFPDSDFDSITPKDGTKTLAQAPRAFFACMHAMK